MSLYFLYIQKLSMYILQIEVNSLKLEILSSEGLCVWISIWMTIKVDWNYCLSKCTQIFLFSSLDTFYWLVWCLIYAWLKVCFYLQAIKLLGWDSDKHDFEILLQKYWCGKFSVILRMAILRCSSIAL